LIHIYGENSSQLTNDLQSRTSCASESNAATAVTLWDFSLRRKLGNYAKARHIAAVIRTAVDHQGLSSGSLAPDSAISTALSGIDEDLNAIRRGWPNFLAPQRLL
jgi:hypothetical protein